MFSVTVFFIASSDSGTYINGMLTSGGDTNPPWQLRITWGVTEGLVAAVLLYGGGFGALQTASVVTGFPFMIILFLIAFLPDEIFHAGKRRRLSAVREKAHYGYSEQA